MRASRVRVWALHLTYCAITTVCVLYFPLKYAQRQIDYELEQAIRLGSGQFLNDADDAMAQAQKAYLKKLEQKKLEKQSEKLHDGKTDQEVFNVNKHFQLQIVQGVFDGEIDVEEIWAKHQKKQLVFDHERNTTHEEIIGPVGGASLTLTSGNDTEINDDVPQDGPMDDLPTPGSLLEKMPIWYAPKKAANKAYTKEVETNADYNTDTKSATKHPSEGNMLAYNKPDDEGKSKSDEKTHVSDSDSPHGQADVKTETDAKSADIVEAPPKPDNLSITTNILKPDVKNSDASEPLNQPRPAEQSAKQPTMDIQSNPTDSTKSDKSPLVAKRVEQNLKNQVPPQVPTTPSTSTTKSNKPPATSSTIDESRLRMFTLSDDFKETLLRSATKVSEANGTVYLTLVNDAYYAMTQSWLCNTAPMPHVHDQVIIVSLQYETCEKLDEAWAGNITCIVVDNVGTADGSTNSSTSVSSISTSFNGSYVWGHKSYIDVLTLRAVILKHLIDNDLPVVLFETDSVWLRNPMAYFDEFAPAADVVVPLKGYQEKHLTLSFDPMLLRVTDATKAFLNEMVDQLISDAKLFDQDVLDLLCKSQYHGLHCDSFPWEEVADGLWYKLANGEKVDMHQYVINNNFISGIDAKITRAAMNGHWFTRIGDPKGCDKKRVLDMLRKNDVAV